jgi:hypothetical protein
MKTVVKIALGVILGGALLIGGGVALLGMGLNEAQKTSDRNGITRGQFDRIRTGTTEAEVNDIIGDVPEASSSSYSLDVAAQRIGSRCLYYNEIGRLVSIYQLCFSEQTGRLESKTSLGGSGSSSSVSVPPAAASAPPVTTSEAPPAAAEPDRFEVVDAFKTPSGRSACQLLKDANGASAVQCGPVTASTAYRLVETGRASRVPWEPPSSDAGPADYNRTLYLRGGTPKLDGGPTDLRCVVHENTGVECLNEDGHGFRVSVQAQRAF